MGAVVVPLHEGFERGESSSVFLVEIEPFLYFPVALRMIEPAQYVPDSFLDEKRLEGMFGFAILVALVGEELCPVVGDGLSQNSDVTILVEHFLYELVAVLCSGLFVLASGEDFPAGIVEDYADLWAFAWNVPVHVPSGETVLSLVPDPVLAALAFVGLALREPFFEEHSVDCVVRDSYPFFGKDDLLEVDGIEGIALIGLEDESSMWGGQDGLWPSDTPADNWYCPCCSVLVCDLAEAPGGYFEHGREFACCSSSLFVLCECPF